jgi:hypothetical protein
MFFIAGFNFALGINELQERRASKGSH